MKEQANVLRFGMRHFTNRFISKYSSKAQNLKCIQNDLVSFAQKIYPEETRSSVDFQLIEKLVKASLLKESSLSSHQEFLAEMLLLSTCLQLPKNDLKVWRKLYSKVKNSISEESSWFTLSSLLSTYKIKGVQDFKLIRFVSKKILSENSSMSSNEVIFYLRCVADCCEFLSSEACQNLAQRLISLLNDQELEADRSQFLVHWSLAASKVHEGCSEVDKHILQSGFSELCRHVLDMEELSSFELRQILRSMRNLVPVSKNVLDLHDFLSTIKLEQLSLIEALEIAFFQLQPSARHDQRHTLSRYLTTLIVDEKDETFLNDYNVLFDFTTTTMTDANLFNKIHSQVPMRIYPHLHRLQLEANRHPIRLPVLNRDKPACGEAAIKVLRTEKYLSSHYRNVMLGIAFTFWRDPYMQNLKPVLGDVMRHASLTWLVELASCLRYGVNHSTPTTRFIFKQLGEEITQRICRGEHLGLSHVYLLRTLKVAYETFPYSNTVVFEALLRQEDELGRHSVSRNTFRAVAGVMIRGLILCPATIDAFVEQVLAQEVDEFTSGSVLDVLMCCAKFKYKPESFTELVELSLSATLIAYRNGDLAVCINMLTQLAILDFIPADVIKTVLTANHPPFGYSRREMASRQYLAACLSVLDDQFECPFTIDTFGFEFKEKRGIMEELEFALTEKFAPFGVAIQTSVVRSNFLVDFEIQVDDHKPFALVLLPFSQLSRTSADNPARPLGLPLLHKAFLERQGYHVVHVNTSGWKRWSQRKIGVLHEMVENRDFTKELIT